MEYQTELKARGRHSSGRDLHARDRRKSSAVTYSGPTTISGITRLTASTTLSNVVGINWRIDNKAFGTASVSPYNFDANAALLPSGQHTMTVIAIDRNGTRTVSPEVRVNIGGAPTGAGIVHLHRHQRRQDVVPDGLLRKRIYHDHQRQGDHGIQLAARESRGQRHDSRCAGRSRLSGDHQSAFKSRLCRPVP